MKRTIIYQLGLTLLFMVSSLSASADFTAYPLTYLADLHSVLGEIKKAQEENPELESTAHSEYFSQLIRSTLTKTAELYKLASTNQSHPDLVLLCSVGKTSQRAEQEIRLSVEVSSNIIKIEESKIFLTSTFNEHRSRLTNAVEIIDKNRMTIALHEREDEPSSSPSTSSSTQNSTLLKNSSFRRKPFVPMEETDVEPTTGRLNAQDWEHMRHQEGEIGAAIRLNSQGSEKRPIRGHTYSVEYPVGRRGRGAGYYRRLNSNFSQAASSSELSPRAREVDDSITKELEELNINKQTSSK